MVAMGSGHDKKKRRAKRAASRAMERARRDEARAVEPGAPPPAGPSDAGDPDALVGAPLKPRPNLRSGAVAIPEPTESEERDMAREVAVRLPAAPSGRGY